MVGTAKPEKANRGRVKALDRLEQPDHGDLREVIQRLAASVVAARDAAGQGLEAAKLLEHHRILIRASQGQGSSVESPRKWPRP